MTADRGEALIRAALAAAPDPDHPDVRAVEDLLRELEDLRRGARRLQRGDPAAEIARNQGPAWFVVFYRDDAAPFTRGFVGEGAEEAARHVHRELAANWTGAFLARSAE